MTKRYEALYLHKNFCDGFYDNYRERYLENDEIENILNNNYNQTKVWQDKYDELKKEYLKLKKRIRKL